MRTEQSQCHRHKPDTQSIKKATLAFFMVTLLIRQTQMCDYPQAHKVRENPPCDYTQVLESKLPPLSREVTLIQTFPTS